VPDSGKSRQTAQGTVTEIAPARAYWKKRDTFTLALFSITLVNHPDLLKNVLIVVMVVDFSLPRHAFTAVPFNGKSLALANSCQPVPKQP
jgi:hypothetical protein